MRQTRYSGKLDSSALDKKLQQVLIRRDAVETNFRVKHVRKWTVMFCDVSRTLNLVTTLNEDERIKLTEEYHSRIVDIIKKFDPSYYSTTTGPQVVVCFETAENAAKAAVGIQLALNEWKDKYDGHQHFIPSIGLHTGDLVLKDDELQQSNACNLGKRIETEAKVGDIFISAATYAQLMEEKKYQITFVRSAMVKNIPEPQKIYSLSWKTQKAPVLKSNAKGPLINLTKTEEVTQGYMGILICDVSGSSRKFWNLGDREGNMLIEIYRKEVFPILMKYKAVNIEISEGDMISACFAGDKIINTVLAAIEIQKELFRRNVNMANRQRYKLETSIGLHAGEVEIRDKKITHNSIFYTCKSLQDQAEANEIFVSEEMKTFLQKYPNIKLIEAGETTIKGSIEKIKMFNLEWFRSGR